jgi:hypothetical protein
MAPELCLYLPWPAAFALCSVCGVCNVRNDVRGVCNVRNEHGLLSLTYMSPLW